MVFPIKLKIRKPEAGNYKNLTRQQKVDRLLKMEFRNPKEVLKAIVAMEFESLGVSIFKNQEEMDEFVARKRQRLLEIEMEKKKETMPEQLMDAINEFGGDDVMWVMEKILTSTDMRPSHNRLSIPERQVRSKFLTDEERMQASKDGIPVDVLVLGKGTQQPDLWSLVFKKWSMNKTNIYVLIRRWAKLVKEESLEEGHTIQIWSFRCSENGGGGKKLCFAINVV